MKIFLSYAREQRLLAEEIHAALSVRSHDVFFDRSTLKAGKEYDVTIKKNIEGRQLFIFLISPEAVKPETYALTELGWAKAKWKNPSGRILPVMVRPTVLSKVDAYLRAVTILYPQGNVATEVATAVDALTNKKAEELEVPLTEELQRGRIVAYKGLWELTQVLPKWPRAEKVDYKNLRKLSESLRDWYFTAGGGMFLSRSAHTAYAALQDSLTAILGERSSGVMTGEHYDVVRDLCSALRSRLARDIGARA